MSPCVSVDVDGKGKETRRSPVFYSSRMKTANGTQQETTIYETMAHDEATKIRWGGIDDTATNYEKFGRMYQKAQQNVRFNALRLYCSKLNQACNAFFSSFLSDSGRGQKNHCGSKIDV